MKYLFAFALCFGIVAGVAGAQAAPLAPSAIVASASTYDTQTVTVSGTVKNVKTRQGQRGTITSYQLCDTQCVNVVQFGEAKVTEGQTSTVSGRFRAKMTRGDTTIENVIMVGGRPPGGQPQ
jgi:hypothetical protein